MPSSVDDRRLPESAACWLDAELAGKDIPPLIVAIGLSDPGLLSVIDRRAPNAKVLVFEPDAGAGARFLEHPDARRWRESGRLVYLVDPDYAGAEDAWRQFPPSPDAHKLIVRPEVARDGGPAALRAARAFKQILFGVRANAEARKKFAPGYLAGSLHNLPEIVAGQDIRALTNAYAGVPGIIVAAGPSLDGMLDDLAAAGDRAVIFAADTALRPLRARRLSPQFVVAVDPQPVNARHFHELPPCPDTWLVSEGSIHPSVVAPFGHRAFWFRVSNHEPWSWYNESGVDIGRLDVWGSVVTAAFQAAVLAGCDPIVFAGADLSFTGNHPYCRGTTYEFDWAHATAEGQPLERAWRPFLRIDEQIRVPDIHGRETATTSSLKSFRDWLVARAARSGRRVINATGAGILIGDGIEQRSLREVLTTPCQVPKPSELAPVPPTRASRADLARRLWDVHRSVCRNTQSTPPVDRWKAFCGDGFSPDAVGAALERAARVLERPEVEPSALQTTIPWPQLPDAGASRSIQTRLPEAMLRWRSVLSGAPVEPSAIDSAGGADRLIEAFDILRSICTASAALPDLATPVAAGLAGCAPLGALHTWPVELGRAVRLFEALLGEAWTASTLLAQSEGSYFTRYVAERSTDFVRSSAAATHAQVACRHLALEWLLCASHLHATETSRVHVAARCRALMDFLTTSSGKQLELDADGSDSIGLPLSGDDPALARLLTGSVRGASLCLRVHRDAKQIARMPMATPRILTDEGIVRAVLPYSAGPSALCTALRGAESFYVHENGSTSPGLSWPRAINGQLPFGDGGAVAWSVGPAARFPEGGSGYVMYRRSPEAEPKIEALPFSPQTGVWWRDRFHWACFPFGVGSWAPGIAPEFALADLTLFSVQGDEQSLVLGPRARTSDGAAVRQLISRGWRWLPDRDPEPLSLGPLGVASSHAIAHEWTAVAHPEADAVALQRKDGVRVTMTCYYPFGIAWAGRSLLVSTADGELLLFERFTEQLDAWVGGRS